MDNDVITAITSELDRLADLRARLDVLRLQKEELRDTVLTEEIKQQLQDIELEFLPSISEAEERIAEATENVKAATLAAGVSVRGQRMQAVFCKGRDRWDAKRLMRLAKDHPAIWEAHEEGEPYITLRNVG